MTNQDPPATALEVCRYQMARRFLAEGQRDGALVIAGELLNSGTGRRLAHALLGELYPRHPVGTVTTEDAIARKGERIGTNDEGTIEASGRNARADAVPPELTGG
jgi:hypothetical protein